MAETYIFTCLTVTPAISKAAEYLGIKDETFKEWLLTYINEEDDEFNFDAAFRTNRVAAIKKITNHHRKNFQSEHLPKSKAVLESIKNLFADFKSTLELSDNIDTIYALIDSAYDTYVNKLIKDNPNSLIPTREDFYANNEFLVYESVKQALNEARNGVWSEEKGVEHILPLTDENGNNISLANDEGEMTQEMADSLDKLMNHFDDLWLFAKMQMKSRQGILMDCASEDVALIDYDTDVVLSQTYDDWNDYVSFDYENAPKESWMEVKEFIKAFTQLSAETRRILSEVPQYDIKGNVQKNKFGITRMENVARLHKRLVLEMYDVRDELEMIDRLTEMELNGDAQAGVILSKIDATRYGEEEFEEGDEISSALKTSLHNRSVMFLDMQRSPMMYCVAKISRTFGKIKKYITSINTTDAQSGNVLYRKFVNAAVKKAVDLSKSKIFRNGKMTNTARINLQKHSAKLSAIKPYDNNATDAEQNNVRKRVETFITTVSATNQYKIISEILDDFGIPYTRENLVKLLRLKSNNDLATLLVNLKDLVDRTNRENIEGKDFTDVISSPLSSAQNDTLKIALSLILRILNKDNHYVQHTFKSSGTFMNPRKGQVEYQTAQLRGFLTDFFGDIRNCIKKTLDNKEKEDSLQEKDENNKPINYLKEYIKKKFLNNPLFVEYNEDGTLAKDSEGKYIIKNYWLEQLYNSDLNDPNSFANIFFHYQFIGSEKGRTKEGSHTFNSDAQTFEDFSELDFITTLFTGFVTPRDSHNLGSGIGRNYADYPTFILGDSGKQKFIRARRLNVENGEIIKKMVTVVQQEWKFWQETQLFNNSLELNGNQTFALLDMNKKTDQEKDDFNPFKTFPELKQIMDEDGQDIASLVSNKEWLEEQIKKIMDQRFRKFIQSCENMGVLDTTEMKNGNAKYMTYQHLPLQEDGYTLNMEDGSDNRDIAEKFLRDFYYNSTFATIEQIQITTLSPMLYEHAVELQKRNKLIHANGRRPSIYAKDYKGKRYSQDGMMSYILMNDVVGNPRFANNAAFMDAVAYQAGMEELNYDIDGKTEQEIMDIGKKTRKYKTYVEKTSYTDGQGIRSLEGYRKIKGMLGAWTEQDEMAYDLIMDIRKRAKGREWTKAEKQLVANLTLNWQPIKPFAFGWEEYPLSQNGAGNNFYMPQQIKCSECLIIPELLPKDSRMRIIVEHLDENHIDCAYFDSCIKVGAFGQVETYYKEKPTKENMDEAPDLMSAEDLRNALRGNQFGNIPYIHRMSYENYIEQNAVGEHTYNSRTIGTQMRKLFFDGLREGRSYADYLKNATESLKDGGEITLPNGAKATLDSMEQLVKFYSSLHCANVMAKFEDVMEVIANDDKLSRELLKIALHTDNQTMSKLLMYATQTLFDDAGEAIGLTFPIPLFENSMEHDAAASVISIFKKATILLKSDGGSLVQATAFGISSILTVDGKSSDGGDLLAVVDPNNPHNILYYEAEIPFKLEYTDKYGRKVKLQYDKYCHPDGTLKLMGNGEPLIERDFPGITTMVCYRIPSERHYSAAVIKVKRFSKPVEGGGVIKLPVLITTITGSDFDIDKMFLMRKQFVQKQDAQSFDEYLEKAFLKDDPRVKEIWNYIYSHSGDRELLGLNGDYIMQALKLARAKSAAHQPTEEKHNAELEKPLNSFWDLAKELVPDAFTRADGIMPTKHEVFAFAANKMKNGLNLDYKTKDEFKFYEYNPDVPVDKLGRDIIIQRKSGVKSDVAVRNNMLLHLTIARLQDPETMESRTTPGGFQNMKDAAEDIRYVTHLTEEQAERMIDTNGLNANFAAHKAVTTDPNEALNYSDPMTLVEFNKLNQISMKLVGTFANYNSFKALISSVRLVRLTKPIKMFGRDVVSLNRISIDPRTGMWEVGRPSGLFIAEMLAASVDAVKDPTLKFLNITQSTAPVAALLAMCGYKPMEIGTFLNQPIIRQITKYCETRHCGLSTAINAMKEEHFKDKKATTGFYERLTTLSLLMGAAGVELVDKMLTKKDDIMFMDMQFDVLLALEEIVNSSLSLSAHLNATKLTSANSIESTFGSIYSLVLAAEKLNNTSEKDKLIKIQTLLLNATNSAESSVSPIDTSLDIQEEGYMSKVLQCPFPIEQVIYDACKSFIKHTLKFFPYNNTTYKTSRDFFKSLTVNETLTPKTINSIHHDVQVFALRQVPNNLFSDASIVLIKEDPVMGTTFVGYKPQEFFTQEFPEQFRVFLEENADKYPTMYRCLDFDGKRINLTFGYDKDADEDAFVAEWRSIIDNEVSDGLNMGYGLYFYNYHANQFQFNRRTFGHLFPRDKFPGMIVGYAKEIIDGHETLVPVLYKDVLDFIKDGSINVNHNFFIQWLLNHHNNGEFVKTIYDDKQEKLLKLNINNEGNIVFDPGLDNFNFMILNEKKDEKSKKSTYKLPPAIKINGQFYIAAKYNNVLGQYQIVNEVEEGQTVSYVPFRTYDTLTYSNMYVQTGENITAEDGVTTEDLLDGSMLEPITWKKLEEIRNGSSKHDYRIATAILNEARDAINQSRYDSEVINAFLNDLQNVYTLYMQDLADKLDAGGRLMLKHKALMDAYNNNRQFTDEQKEIVKSLNRNIITRMMIQQLCPDFRLLSGSDKAELYNEIGTKVMNDNLTQFEDIKNCVIDMLLDKKGTIEQQVEASKLASLGEMINSEEPLAQNGEEISATCRT